MSALEDGISTVTGDISASMTTTNSILSDLVWQIKDGICNTKKMGPIASKAINKEAVMFQRIFVREKRTLARPLQVVAWAWRNGHYKFKAKMDSKYAQLLEEPNGTIFIKIAQHLIWQITAVLSFIWWNENDLWSPIRNNQ